MSVLEKIKASVKPWHRRIALIVDEREDFFKGVSQVLSEGLGSLTLIGDKEKIEANLLDYGISTSKVEIVDCRDDYRTKMIIAKIHTVLVENVKISDIHQFLEEHVYLYGMMFVKLGFADILITPKLIAHDEFAALGKLIIGNNASVKTVSSTYLMVTNTDYGDKGALFFSDCEIIKNPTSEQLSEITISTVELAEKVFGTGQAKASLLSFSSKGSANHPLVDKVIAAGNILEKKHCLFNFDYELQLDASIEPSVGQRKAPKSNVAGYANVLIYPDLQAANIGRQLVTSFGGSETIGPITLGLKNPSYQLPEEYTEKDLVLLIAIGIISST